MTAGRALLATCHPCPPGSLRSKRTSGYGWLLPTGTGRTEIMPDLTLPSPAKLNLFLHIVGRRPDGYHELQTLFQFLDYGDELSFTLTPDEPGVRLADPIPGVPDSDNLIIRAAQALAALAEKPLPGVRSEEHTSELQSRPHLVCRLLLEKKKRTRRCGTEAETLTRDEDL